LIVMPRFALQIHRVEHCSRIVTTRDGVRELEDAIGQGDFPWSDVGDVEKLRMRSCVMTGEP